MLNKYDMQLKIVLVGDFGSGKSSLVRREIQNLFTQAYKATVALDYRNKEYKVGKANVTAGFWDTVGQERYRSIIKLYYKNADTVCLCFDLSNRESFLNLNNWLIQIKDQCLQVPIFLIGCKSDLEIAVPTDQILMFANAFDLSFAQTSVKNNQGVNQVFRKIVQEAVQAKLFRMAFENQQIKLKRPPSIGNRNNACC